MSEKTYWLEQYKNPKWQKKRLEILERDDFTCTSCGENEKTLNVHHQWYNKDCKVWEYDNKCFLTLCDGCHENWHDMKKHLNYVLVNCLIMDGWDIWEIDGLLINAINKDTTTLKTLSYLLAEKTKKSNKQ